MSRIIKIGSADNLLNYEQFIKLSKKSYIADSDNRWIYTIVEIEESVFLKAKEQLEKDHTISKVVQRMFYIFGLPVIDYIAIPKKS